RTGRQRGRRLPRRDGGTARPLAWRRRRHDNSAGRRRQFLRLYATNSWAVRRRQVHRRRKRLRRRRIAPARVIRSRLLPRWWRTAHIGGRTWRRVTEDRSEEIGDGVVGLGQGRLYGGRRRKSGHRQNRH